GKATSAVAEVAGLPPSPLGGEGLGVRGLQPPGAPSPHPPPLSPTGRGEETPPPPTPLDQTPRRDQNKPVADAVRWCHPGTRPCLCRNAPLYAPSLSGIATTPPPTASSSRTGSASATPRSTSASRSSSSCNCSTAAAPSATSSSR